MLLTKIGSNALKKCVTRIGSTPQSFSPMVTTSSIGGMTSTTSTNCDKTTKTKQCIQNMFFSSSSVNEDGNGPSLEMAKSMKTSFQDMDNQNLIIMANIDSSPIAGAREEVLKRHIMSVDNVDYEEASKTFQKIKTKKMEYSSILKLPYNIGIFSGITAGFASFPLCFHLDTVKWFNHHFVTTEVPPVQDLETLLEVGDWAWNWMDPPLGQISFFLLCLQFSRNQMQNLGLKPYTEKIKSKRADRICKEFPMYDKDIIVSYSMSNGL